ncbi:MAG: RidA family protein [Actinomycetales bacterium]|jgi:enamine deaminase RidA (YjgF/YER057c/UK114 family)|nr:MAG: RidA family protein [Actinomycetales bacterium]
MSFDDNFAALASKPTGAFNVSLSAIRYLNNSFYASGQVARRGEIMVATGLVGSEVNMELAQECAWVCAMNVLESVQKELGSLDKIEYVARLGIYVASADGFSDQHLVAHGASQVILNVFGDVAGKHSRTAIGVASLPLNSPVEVDAIFVVRK